MSDEIVAIIIVAIIVSGIVRIVRIRTGAERGRLRDGHGQAAQPLLNQTGPSPREVELQREVVDLRERVQVLERIATDGRKSRDLADEIESLRSR